MKRRNSYLTSASDQITRALKNDPKCETAEFVLENGVAVCENCGRPIDEIFGDRSTADGEGK